MEFVKFTDADLDDLVVLEKELYLDNWNRKALESELKNQYSHIYLLKDGENIIGYYGVWIVSDYSTITKVSVAKKYQGKGYSNDLMDHMINLCLENGCVSIDLEVRETNLVAINLYKKHGFIQTGIRPKYYKECDALLMVKKLRKGCGYEKISVSA